MIDFYIHGNPVAQGRPRFARRGNFVTTYDPPESKSFKETVKWQAIESGANERLLEGPLEMTLVFSMQRPQGHYGKKGLRPSAPKHHIVKPDLDNLAKGVKDGLEGICFSRDQQVVSLDAKKEYVKEGSSPGVRVIIREIEEV